MARCTTARHRDAIATLMKLTLMSAATAATLLIGLVSTNAFAITTGTADEPVGTTIGLDGTVKLDPDSLVQSATITFDASTNIVTLVVNFAAPYPHLDFCDASLETANGSEIIAPNDAKSLNETSATFTYNMKNSTQFNMAQANPSSFLALIDCQEEVKYLTY